MGANCKKSAKRQRQIENFIRSSSGIVGVRRRENPITKYIYSFRSIKVCAEFTGMAWNYAVF